MAIHVRWRLTGQVWQEREYPDDRLDELMARAWEKFGDKTIRSTSVEKPPISTITKTPRRKK